MTPIEWRKDFATGIAAVDYEHEQLIALINGLVHTLGRDAAKEAVAAVLGEIYAKISAHFALEEKIMRERRYDQLADHKADHERLLDEIRDIMDAVDQAAGFDYRGALAERLNAWFVVHFKTKDARLHKMLG